MIDHRPTFLTVIGILCFIVVGLSYSCSAKAVGIGNDNPPGYGGDQTLVQGQIQAQSVSNRISNESRASAKTYVTNNLSAPAAQPVNVTYNEAQPLAVTRQEIAQDTLTVRSVPNVFSGNTYPTAPCMGSTNIGAAAIGWGASIGTSWADHECGKRETARSFHLLGLPQDALAVLCSSEYAAVAPSCKTGEPK